MMHEIRIFFNRTGTLWHFFILILLRCPFNALFTILQACFLQFAFEAINQKDISDLYHACAMFGIGSLLLFLYNGTVWTSYAVAITRWIGKIRRQLFEHISGLSLHQIEARSSGEWITRLNADVQASSALLNGSLQLPHAVVAVVNICVSGVILYFINPTLFGVTILFVIPHVMLNQLILAKPMTKLKMKVQEVKAKNSADLDAIIVCADTAVLYHAQELLLSRFKESSLKLQNVNMKLCRRNAMGNSLLPFMGMSGYLLLLYIGGKFITSGAMSFGELTAVFQYRGGVLTGTMMLGASLMNMKASLAGIQRVNETINMKQKE